MGKDIGNRSQEWYWVFKKDIKGERIKGEKGIEKELGIEVKRA